MRKKINVENFIELSKYQKQKLTLMYHENIKYVCINQTKFFLRKKIKRDDDGCRLKTYKRNGIKRKKVHKYRENWKT